MANLLSLFLFLACLLLIFLGIDRGFDISDEGFYVLLTVPTQENQSGIINYDLFFKLLFQLSGYSFSFVEMRLLRLGSYILAAIALTQFIKSHFSISLKKIDVYFLSILGLFSGYAFLPPTLSYNSLTVVLGSFWLINIFSSQSKYKKTAILGFILGILVYVKVTVALILFLFSIGVLVKNKQFSFVSLGLLIFPFLIFEVIFLVFLGDFALVRLFDAIPLNSSRPSYELILLLKSPIVGFVFTLIGLVIGGSIAKVKGQSYPILLFTLIIVVGVFISLVNFTHITKEWNHVVLLATAVLLGFLRFNFKSDRAFSLEEMALFFLPFLLHLGSNVYWLRIGIHYWVFWILLVLIYSVHYPKTVLNSVSVLASLLVFNGIWWHPFGQNELWNATEYWEYEGGKSIRLSEKQVKLLKELKDQIGPEKQEILAVYRIPGLVYLLGNTLPKSPGIWDRPQLEKYFPNGYHEKMILYFPLEELPKNFTGKKVLISYPE